MVRVSVLPDDASPAIRVTEPVQGTRTPIFQTPVAVMDASPVMHAASVAVSTARSLMTHAQNRSSSTGMLHSKVAARNSAPPVSGVGGGRVSATCTNTPVTRPLTQSLLPVHVDNGRIIAPGKQDILSHAQASETLARALNSSTSAQALVARLLTCTRCAGGRRAPVHRRAPALLPVPGQGPHPGPPGRVLGAGQRRPQELAELAAPPAGLRLDRQMRAGRCRMRRQGDPVRGPLAWGA